MIPTMEDYLKVVEPYLHHNLISPENWSHIKTLARILPPASTAYLECRLGDERANSDFSLPVSFSDGSCGVLAGHHSSFHLSDSILTHPVWQRIREFCVDWTKPTSFLHERIKVFCLEFDVDGSVSDVPVPNLIFFEVDSNIQKRQKTIEMVLNSLLENPLPFNYTQNLQKCLNLLPTSTECLMIGVQIERKSDSLRVEVDLGTIEEQMKYLSKLNWLGQREEIEAIISMLSGHVDRVCFAFDVGEIIYPKIGLECYIDHNKFERWPIFLDYLVAMKLCLPEKSEALQAWLGFSDERSNTNLWPSFLLKASKSLGTNTISSFARGLSHVKIVYEPGQPLEAKAYPFFTHLWLKTRRSTGH